MGQKDITEKILEDYNDVFADIVNGLIFKGEQRIKPEDLRSKNVTSQYKAENDGKIHEQERDVVKDWVSSNVRIAVCGLENQTKPEKYMPARIFGYEGASYRAQILENSSNLAPVITLVLYFGTEKRWEYPKTIKEIVDIPDGMEEYVNDCKINVFEIAWLSDEEISRFTSDFKIVANFFSKKRRDKNYIPDDKTEIQHVDEILKLLSVMTGDNRYEKILASKDKEVHSMCDVANRIESKGKIEGAITAYASCNFSAKEIVEKLVLTFGISKEEAQQSLSEYKGV